MSGRFPFAAVLFDLDGTLIDSVPDLADSLNLLLAEHALPPHGMDAVRRMIGHGVVKLVERGFAAHGVPLEPETLAVRAARFVEIYEPRATRDTVLYPAVAEIVPRLAEAGLPLAVCTNKPTAVSREILSTFGLLPHLKAVVGGDFGPPRKPAPDLLLECARLVDADPARCLMVGDSAADVDSARAAGMPVWVVRYGYTQTPPDQLGADRVIDDIAAVAESIFARL